jgi:hypothetical protein
MATTEAVLTIDWRVAGSTSTVIVVVADCPTARSPKATVTTLPLTLAVPAPPAETNWTPAGNVSVTVTPVASDGPSFRTSKVYTN